VLKASDLSFVCPYNPDGLQIVYPKVDANGFVYLYNLAAASWSNAVEGVHMPRYRFRWDELVTNSSLSNSLTRVEDMVLWRGQCRAHAVDAVVTMIPYPCARSSWGVFARRTNVISVFGGNCNDCNNPDDCRHGIHAFSVDDTGTNGVLVKSSSLNSNAVFFCEFHETNSFGQEPEGLVIAI